jgi:hypothetical protein
MLAALYPSLQNEEKSTKKSMKTVARRTIVNLKMMRKSKKKSHEFREHEQERDELEEFLNGLGMKYEIV